MSCGTQAHSSAKLVTKQSLVSMKFWIALDAPPPSENESEEDSDGKPDDGVDAEGDEVHAAKKARFEAFRNTLVGTSVEVNSPLYIRLVFLLTHRNLS